MIYEKKENRVHQSVLLEEVIRYLEPERGGWYLDCTLGGGGHTAAIAHILREKGKIISIDLDPDLVSHAAQAFSDLENVVVRNENYRNSHVLMEEMGISGFDGIVLDLGFSSYHVECALRGFSFQTDEVLDMRYDPESGGVVAGDVLSKLSREEIRDILYRYGEERQAGRIASAIVAERKKEKIRTSAQLKRIVQKAKGKKGGHERIHAATKTFQALRIYVNKELENLERFLDGLPFLLRIGGRITIISYHSLEDRIVKSYFNKYSGKCVCEPGLPGCVCGKERIMKVITPKPVRPGAEEISINRRARSARLRVAQKGEDL